MTAMFDELFVLLVVGISRLLIAGRPRTARGRECRLRAAVRLFRDGCRAV
jgi:hypothetical protein